MEPEKRNHYLNKLIALFFLLAFITGFSSYPLKSMPGIQQSFWGLSAIFTVMGAALMGSKLTRQDHDIPAAGFNLLAIGNTMIYGFLIANDTEVSNYAGSIVLYVPGLLLVSAYKLFPKSIRISGFIAALGFASLCMLLNLDAENIKLIDIITSISYVSLNLTILGWSWITYRS